MTTRTRLNHRNHRNHHHHRSSSLGRRQTLPLVSSLGSKLGNPLLAAGMWYYQMLEKLR
jgi:hypothetical protein